MIADQVTMERLYELEQDASRYKIVIEKDGVTPWRKEICTVLFDRFYSMLLLNSVSLEEYEE